jgi:hypothetical protein
MRLLACEQGCRSGQGQIEQPRVACPIRAQYPRTFGHSWLVMVSLFPLHVRKMPRESMMGFAFQASHASSILVTRSRASYLVNGAFTAPELFEHGDDKNNHAGHLFS